jgi:zinc protease
MIRKTVAGGTDPKTTTILSFYGPATLTRHDQWQLQALGRVIQLRLTQRLRERLGGTYSVQVNAVVQRLPQPQYSLDVSFVSAPERAAELTRAALDELAGLQRAPALVSDVQKVREAQLRTFHESLVSDGVWAQRIALYDDLAVPFAGMTDDALYKSWTAADVQTAARTYLDLQHFAHFDLVPAPPAAASATP